MIVTPIKTHKITTEDNIFRLLNHYFSKDEGSTMQDKDNDELIQDSRFKIQGRSVLAVTSKIVSLTEGRVAPLATDKQQLIEEESSWYLPRTSSKYDVQFTIKNNILAASAGVDESNADGQYVLWPEDPQKSANRIREYLVENFGLQEIGVIITDSKTTPLRWGVTGISLAHSGFAALKDYIGTEDVFGRKFHYEKLNIADVLASSAVAVMGEGAEQTPMAVITDLPFVQFQDRNPTEEELRSLIIAPEDDLYAPLLTSVKWEKGKSK